MRYSIGELSVPARLSRSVQRGVASSASALRELVPNNLTRKPRNYRGATMAPTTTTKHSCVSASLPRFEAARPGELNTWRPSERLPKNGKHVDFVCVNTSLAHLRGLPCLRARLPRVTDSRHFPSA